MIHCTRIQRILLIAILAALVGCTRPHSFGIVFVSDRDGNAEIYRMTSDSQDIERLTKTRNANEQVVISSPNGRKILFDRGGMRLEREIYLLDLESGSISQLTDAPAYDMAGAWSPDSRQIAFISDRDGGYYRLYLMNSDGSDQKHVPLPTDSERDVNSVAWSPDGRYIVYGTTQHVHAQEVLTPTLYTLNLSSREVIRLTDEELGACEKQNWSPNGEWIAVICGQGLTTYDPKGIYLVRPDASESKQLVDDEVFPSCDEPSWSPNSDWIAMVCTMGIPSKDYGEVYIIRTDGSGLRQVTDRAADTTPGFTEGTFRTWVRRPLWSPDGEHIVYVGVLNGVSNIYIIGIDGQNNLSLTNEGTTNWLESVYRVP